jgi:hypothetical protein
MIAIIINNQIDILDIFTLCISIVALLATLRKKGYGKFHLVLSNNKKNGIWIKLIKSDIYEVKLTCEPYDGMAGKICLLYPDTENDSFYDFINELNSEVEFGSIKVDTILKLKYCESTKIYISFRDKYNNLYYQWINQNKISRRIHKNMLNLTFTGT